MKKKIKETLATKTVLKNQKYVETMTGIIVLWTAILIVMALVQTCCEYQG